MSKAPPFNLAQYIIGEPATKWPDKTALDIIIDPENPYVKSSWTYAALEQDILKTAKGLLDAGIMPGTPVLLRLNNNANFVFAFFGLIAAGAIPVSLSPSLTNNEISFFIKDTGGQFMLKSRSLSHPDHQQICLISETELEAMRCAAEKCDDKFSYAQTTTETPAFLIYTSGTTSQPKGVLHAQRVILGRTPMKAGWHDIKENDRVLHAGDYNWTYTLGTGLMDPWASGATACLYEGNKSPEIWPTVIETAQPTIFATVPGVYRQILKHSAHEKHQFQSLRHCLSAGETLPDKLKKAWFEETGSHIYEAMGQSEISTYVSTSPHIKVPRGAKGRIQQGRNIVILPASPRNEAEGLTPLPASETGIIAIHEDDPGLMLGYWSEKEGEQSSRRGPWFLTGDLGSLDDQGNLTHHGRMDEIMNPSGYRVSPQEVETAIAAHHLVHEVAVYEKQVRPDLTIIEALIVPRDQTLLREKPRESSFIEILQTDLRTKLANYKQPKDYRLVQNLPRNRAGKLIRSRLANWP